MSKIHEASEVALLPQFNLWTVPPTQTSVLNDIEYELRPIATFDAKSPIKFEHVCPFDEYVMLNESHLNLRLKLKLLSTDPAKKPINAQAWNTVTPVNNFMHSLFESVSIKVNNTDISRSPSSYAYRSFFETFLSFADSAKQGHLQCVGYNDEAEKRRKYLFANMNDANDECTIDLENMIHSDLTFQEKAIIGGAKLNFEFLPAKASFYFVMSDPAYDLFVTFEDATLYIHKFRVSQDLERAHRHAIERAPIRYPITRTQVYNMQIQQGVHEALLDNVITGELPRRIFFGLVEHDAFGNGNGLKDPYTFKHFNMNFIACYIGGRQVPNRPYQPDFDEKRCTREYRSLYRALNQTGTDTYLTLSKDAWMKEKCIFGFNFAPDCSNGAGGGSDHVNLKENGALRMHLKFKKPLSISVNVVLFAEFDNCIEIDSLGQVMVDYI